ncbi:MAG: WYL domain-containing protein [Sinobacteraceae bacterium]|nr:WYL domain-containing protein [Nevskiaceae bacterium]
MDQFDRVFRLHRLLAGRKTAMPADDLCIELDCSRATLYRHLAYLRDAHGAPLVHDREHGGYRYEGGARFELPGLWFSADELAALLVLDDLLERQPFGLLAQTLSPFRARLEKLAQHAGVGLPNWRSRLRLLRMAARPVGAHFPLVAEALARRQRLRIDYHARSDDRMASRVVSPQQLVLYRDNWYLDAWCHKRKDLRIFALDRIIAAEKLNVPARELAPKRLADTLATSYGIFSGKPTAIAVLRFSPYATRWIAAETWHPQQQDTREDDGALIRRLPYHRSEELVMDILRHGPEVQVLEPPALRETVLARLRAALDAYAPSTAQKSRPPPSQQKSLSR